MLRKIYRHGIIIAITATHYDRWSVVAMTVGQVSNNTNNPMYSGAVGGAQPLRPVGTEGGQSRPVIPATSIVPSESLAGDFVGMLLNAHGDRAEISGNAMNMYHNAANFGLGELQLPGDCDACASRRYVDESDDPSVSFQTPRNISPAMSAAVVLSHEMEHVNNERARAQREDRQIIQQSVSLTYDNCPECGIRYVSGGVTRTTTAGQPESNDNMPADENAENIAEEHNQDGY